VAKKAKTELCEKDVRKEKRVKGVENENNILQFPLSPSRNLLLKFFVQKFLCPGAGAKWY
jgi:hypothetical protein